MARQITLTLNNGTYNVLRCNYVFNREVDYRGRPTTGLLGGDIKIEIETTGDDYLWERLSGRKPRPVSGKLEIFDAEEMSPIRVLEWYNGYIYAVDEGMYSLSALPMTQKVLITTKRLDINSVVKLDRRFPQTYGFWWEEYKEPESVVKVEEESEEEEDTTPHILSAAWLNEEDNPITLIPSALEETVTMHIKTTGFDKPENDEEEVFLQIKDEEKNVFFEYTTRPNEEGVIDLDLTVEEIISEKHDTPTEYLKEHPNLKLSLFASWLHNPDEKKEAILEKEKPEIIHLQWQDNTRTVLTHVPEGQNKYVDIYIQAEKFKTDEEGKCTEPLYYEILDDDKNTIYRSAATLSENGSCIIGGFDLQGDIDQYLAENKLPALTTRPSSYTLRAWFESNPDDPKEAVIQEEAQCTVYFRRAQNWDGDYFFDWVRMGDTQDTTDKYDRPLTSKYKNSSSAARRIAANDTVLMNFLKHYTNFEQDWREKYSKYQSTSTYYVPYVGIRQGETVTLRMFVQMEGPCGILTFKAQDESKLSIISETEFNTNTLYKDAKKTSVTKYINPIKIKCLDEIKEITYIDVMAGETLVGQLAVMPNTRYKLQAEIVNVSFDYWQNGQKKEKPYNAITTNDKRIIYAKKLLQQVNIELDLEIHRKVLDFRNLEEINNDNSSNLKTSLFSKYFLTIGKDINAKIKINGSKLGLDANKTYDVSEFLFERLKKRHNEDSFNTDCIWEKKLLIYLFGAGGSFNGGAIAGIAFRESTPKSCGLFNKIIPVRNNETNQDEDREYTTGNNIAHEILHIFDLDHTFNPPLYILEEATDNIMDYIPGNTDYRKTLWKWQFETITKAIQKNNDTFISKG